MLPKGSQGIAFAPHLAMEPSPSSPEAFEKTILDDRARLATIIKEKHITIEQ
jgi:hypothetical protein